MSNGIFISYRRSDTEGEASRLAEDLRERLDNVQIFRDVETIAPGEDFVEALERALGDCAVMLALVGPTWIDARGEDGGRRLDDPKDWVRLEIGRALARKVRVIPITCRGASEPKAAALPEDLQPLATKQAVEIDNNRWRYDVDRLIERLVQIEGLRRRIKPDPAPGPAPAPAPAPHPVPAPAKSGLSKGLLIGIGVTFAALAGIGLVMQEADDRPATPPPGSDPYASAPTPAIEPPAAVRPAPAPVVPPVAPPVAGPRVASLTGVWRSRDGEVYAIEQDGADVQMALQMNNGLVGAGRGVFNGGVLQLMIVAPVGGAQVQMSCVLQLAPDARSLSGVCGGPGGQTPVSMYR